jgi:N-acetylmuramoyl-L-alanine amidase
MLGLTDNLEFNYQNTPVQKFLLPEIKHIQSDDVIDDNKLTAAVLSISRDAFNLALALDRLEEPGNLHARHLIIDRDGKLYQLAKISQPIYHLPLAFSTYITNYNSIAIEIINAGKLFYTKTNYLKLTSSNPTGQHSFSIKKANIKAWTARDRPHLHYFETLYYNQYITLCNLLNLLLRLSPNLRIVDCARWPELHQFNIPPVFPRRRLGLG